MKRAALAIIFAIVAALSSFPACSGGGLFTFLSVRIKGNGDGTVTAVAINEFTLFPSSVPVMLTLYRADAAGQGEATEIDSAYSADLDMGKSRQLTAETGEGGYFYAEIEYVAGGSARHIQCGTVYYDAGGNACAP